MNKLAAIACVLSALTLAACGRDESTPQVQTVEIPAGSETIPAELLLTKQPDGAVAIQELRQKATVGDEIVMHAYIGGQKKPFIDARAMMLVVDAGLPNQCTVDKDHCTTPWDYCCVDPKELVKSMATVQITGADGKPIKADMRSLNGVKESTEVVIRGVVGKKDANSFVVNATGIYVKGS